MTLRFIPGISFLARIRPPAARRAFVTHSIAAAAAALLSAAAPPAHAAPSEAAAAPLAITVRPGQSLTDIAVAVTQSHDPAVLGRASRALFDANPQAFMKRDPSRLRLGATLTVPPLDASGAALAASAASAGPAAGAAGAARAAGASAASAAGAGAGAGAAAPRAVSAAAGTHA
ncbi:hypothetical protein NAL89_20130, partial [Burkholderia glumae]|nr:hypothetical protein [Burkholderia glumae]